MNKKTIAACAALVVSAAAFADGTLNFKVGGYLRAGLSSTFSDKPALSTKTWLSGIYFNGDSNKTRGRINLNFDGSNDTANYGAFLRLQYTGANDGASASWGYGDVSYADAYVGLFDNVVTVAAGKMKDSWIGSSGFEAYSALDGLSGAAVTVTPVKGLNITGAAVIDKCAVNKEDGTFDHYELSGDSFVGGVKYKNDMFTADASYAGYGLAVANFNYTGVENLMISAEGKVETDHGMDKLGGQRALVDEWVQYKGIENWTFGVLSFQYIDQKSISGANDFMLTVTPAVAYALNDAISFQLEGTYVQPVYDNAPKGYATIVPGVKFSADKTASATVWASISTDNNQAKSSMGLGVIKEF